MIFKGSLLSLESFFSYIDREFFTPQFGKFENISMTADGFKWIVLAFYFAFVLAALLAYYNRVLIGSLPRALAENGCFSAESAKSFSQLGYKGNIFVKLSLLRGSTLRRAVRCVEGEIWESDAKNSARRTKFADFFLPERRYKINFETDRFYIPEKQKDACAMRFEKKGNGILPLVLTVIGGLVAVILIMKVSPMVFDLVDGIVGGWSQE